MVLQISSQFASDFKTVQDISLREKVKSVLQTIKEARKVDDISHFKKISRNDSAYKMGIGFYYIVAVVSSETEIMLMRFLHRDQILQATNSY